MSTNQIALNVTGMTCNNCRKHVTEALEKVNGVSAVDVDLASGTAKVNGEQLDAASLISAVEEEGYKATVKA